MEVVGPDAAPRRAGVDHELNHCLEDRVAGPTRVSNPFHAFLPTRIREPNAVVFEGAVERGLRSKRASK